MSHPALSILIPAAGGSERLGQPKQLVSYKGSSLIQHAVNNAHSLAPGEIIVVTGAHADEVKKTVQQPPVRWLHNPHWSTGMGGSIALGAGAIKPESTGLMILLCDQWRIRPGDLAMLADRWRNNPNRIVVSAAAGQYMPPVIFPATCFQQLCELRGDHGARKVVRECPELLTAVTVANAVFDLDTQSQLDELV
jgi:molybdenum cofactor cytidylyltransferase